MTRQETEAIARSATTAAGLKKDSRTASTMASTAGEPPLSRADKLQLWNDAFTGVAALASLAATVVAARALYAQLRAPKRDRKSAYYRAILLEPAIGALPTFQARASHTLTEHERAIRSAIAQEVPHSAVVAATRTAIREYKQLLTPIKILLLGAAAAWRDDDLREQIRVALDKLEDDVTEPFSDILAGKDTDAESLDDLLHGAVAEVLATIVHYDLALDA